MKTKPKTNSSSDHDLLNDLSGHERLLESDTSGLFRRFRWLLASGIVIAVILVIWSYLNFLCATHVASSNNSANWLLSLFYGGRCNRQSSIGSLPNSGNDNDGQQLSISGTTITLTNGGNVDLSFLTGTPGPPGTNGSNGTNGNNGTTGANGATGATGPAGPGTTVPSCAPGEVVFANGTAFSCVAIPPATVLSAQNGTSLVGTAVELGLNPLLHNTTIPQNNFTLSMTGGVGSGLIQNYVDGTSGTTHGIESRDGLLGNAGINGSIMYSSSNPAALPLGGQGSYVYSFDAQSGYGVSDGLGNIANNFAFPGNFGSQAVNTAGDNAFAGGGNGNYSISTNYATGQSAGIAVNSTPGTIDLNGSDGVGDFAAIRIDGTSSQVRLQETNSSGANGFFNIDSFNNIGQWFMNNNAGGINSIDMLPNNGQTAIYTQGTSGNNTLTLNQFSGLTFDTSAPLVSAPHAFQATQTGEIIFDSALMPGNLAGNPGDVLSSMGAGVAPVWIPANWVTSVTATGPIVSSGGQNPDISLAPCGLNQIYSYNGATWVCSDENLLYYDESSVIPTTAPSASGNNSVAIGDGAISSGTLSMAFGNNVIASGTNSTAFGTGTTASGVGSTVFGSFNQANGDNSIAGGLSSSTSGQGSVAIGVSNTATQDGAVSFGQSNQSTGLYSATLGVSNTASGTAALSFGQNNFAINDGAVALGVSNTASGSAAVAFGQSSTASGFSSVAGGLINNATNTGSVALGFNNTTAGVAAAAIGLSNTASGTSSIALGGGVNATADNAIAIGDNSNANGVQSFTLGSNNTATNNFDFTIGQFNTATGGVSGAVGFNNNINGNQSYGFGTQNFIDAISTGSVAVGQNNQILTGNSYAFGNNNTITVNGGGGRAIGFQTSVDATFGTAIGTLSTVAGFSQTAIGSNNIASGTNVNFNSSKANDEFALILGNADQFAGPSNAWAVSWNGAQTTYGNNGAAIAVAPASTGRIYFDDALQKYRCSENTGAYFDCFGGAAAAVSANNGLTINPANNVQLGGTLVQNTNIALNNFNLSIEGAGGSAGHGLGIGTSGAGARLNLNSWGGGFPNGFGAALKLTDTGGFPAAYFADNTNAGFLIATNNDAAFHVMMVGAGGSAGSYTLNSDQLGRVYIDQSGPTNSLANAHLYVRGMAGMATTSFQTNTIDNITEWGNVFNTAISVVDSQGHLGIGTNTVPVGKVASFAGDVNITGVVDPTALLFSVQTPSSYNPALPGNNGYKIGINTGTSQLPIFVSPLTDARRIFEVRDTSNTAFFSADSLNNRIGIGTTNPVARLTVLGTDNTTSLDASVVIRNLAVDPNAFSKLILSSGSFGGELGAAQSSSITSGYLPGLYMRARNVTDAITFSVGDAAIGAGNGPSVSIVQNGGVGYLGVANSTPAAAIHAGNSTVPISSPNASIRSEDTAGYCEIQGSNGLNCVSDARLKTNVVSLSGSLDKIMQLNGVHYNWKVDPNDNLQTGFIAQDIEAIFPELVKTDATTGLKSVNYDRFTPYIAQAMKEQQAQISSLKTIVGVNDSPTLPSAAESSSLTDRIAALEAHNISLTNTQTAQNTQSVATVVFNGGVVTGDVEFQGEATFIAATTFESTTVFKGDATFEGDVKIGGNLNVSDNTAGTTTLTAGKTRIHVGFAQPHTIAPKVTVTAHGANRIDYGTENVTTTGFDIVIDPVATKNITFDWTALEK